MNGEIGSWLWISDNGPPLVAMLSPPSNRTLAATRGFTGTLQVTWAPVVQVPIPVARFELSVIGIPVVIRSPAQAPTVQAQASPFAGLPSPRISVPAWVGANGSAS